jgi:hypothetical protein
MCTLWSCAHACAVNMPHSLMRTWRQPSQGTFACLRTLGRGSCRYMLSLTVDTIDGLILARLPGTARELCGGYAGTPSHLCARPVAGDSVCCWDPCCWDSCCWLYNAHPRTKGCPLPPKDGNVCEGWSLPQKRDGNVCEGWSICLQVWSPYGRRQAE